MTIVASDVRTYLNNISDTRVPDATIEKQIELAISQVENERSEVAGADAVDNAVLTIAGYISYSIYIGELREEAGVVPALMATNLARLEKTMDRFIEYVKRGTVGYGAVITPIISSEGEQD